MARRDRLPDKPQRTNFNRGVLLVEDWQAMTYVNRSKAKGELDIEQLNFVITLLGRYHKSPIGEAVITKSAFRFMDAIKFLHYLGESIRADVLEMESRLDRPLDEYELETKKRAMAYLDANMALADSFLEQLDGIHRFKESKKAEDVPES